VVCIAQENYAKCKKYLEIERVQTCFKGKKTYDECVNEFRSFFDKGSEELC